MKNAAPETEKAISGAIKINEKEFGRILTDWFDSRSRIR